MEPRGSKRVRKGPSREEPSRLDMRRPKKGGLEPIEDGKRGEERIGEENSREVQVGKKRIGEEWRGVEQQR